MVSKILSASPLGVEARMIEIETHLSGGLPKYFLVGLPDRAVSESISRITAAIKNAKFQFPIGHITVNLAPANLPKEGSAFDLPIAIGLLQASQQIHNDSLQEYLILGELALDGQLRPINGTLPIVVEAQRKGIKHVILPMMNAEEASLVTDINVYGCTELKQVAQLLNAEIELPTVKNDVKSILEQSVSNYNSMLDFADVQGKESVKRALEVAAAGGHNIIMIGPPGSGKTMLAQRISTILPPLSFEEALETTKIHSVSGILKSGTALVVERPFRAPHHTVSGVALVGGGPVPKPGEISKAHNGILFLDELPEFDRKTMEVMRQPLEEGYIHISRAKLSLTYPSNFILVAAMNPSPSGDWVDPDEATPAAISTMKRYMSRISGPLLDRIDMHIEVTKVNFEEISGTRKGESSASIKKRVINARQIQLERLQKEEGKYCNAHFDSRLVRKYCALNDSSKQLIKNAMHTFGLSARGYDRILKMARTIADMSEMEMITDEHLAEAIQYRSLDRDGWLG